MCLSLGSIILGFSAIGPLMSGQLLSFATMFEKSLPLVFVVIHACMIFYYHETVTV